MEIFLTSASIANLAILKSLKILVVRAFLIKLFPYFSFVYFYKLFTNSITIYILGNNFHPDHHLIHMKNFGLQNCLMDMYFGTCTYNEKYMVKPSLYFTDTQEIIFDVEKKIEDDDTVFYFTPRSISREGRTTLLG